jgi:hypothetical protein
MIPLMAVPMIWIASTSPATAAAIAVVPRVKMSCGSRFSSLKNPLSLAMKAMIEEIERLA